MSLAATRPPADCLTEDEVLCLAGGGAPDELVRRADAHLDGCATCRIVVAELAQPQTGHGDDEPRTRERRGMRTFWPGELVAERFRMIGLVGRGGMGEVYEVEDTVLSTKLALKTIAIESQLEEEAIERLKREALLARKVTHPNVCRVFDLYLHVDKTPHAPAVLMPVLTMEFLAGESLSAHMRKARMARGEALRLGAQIAAGLDAAHAAGVLHHDLKSDNIMLVPDPSGPRAVITDFGLARQAPRPGHAHSDVHLAGTLGYLAPEQLQGQPATAASDIFSFGVVLYEMLTGQHPFRGDTPEVVISRTLSARTPSLRERLPHAPPAWDQIFARCLHRAPRRRYPSATAVVKALTRSQDGREALVQRARRSALVTTAALLGLGVLGIATFYGSRALWPRLRPRVVRALPSAPATAPIPAATAPASPIAAPPAVIAPARTELPPPRPRAPAPSRPVALPSNRPPPEPRERPASPRLLDPEPPWSAVRRPSAPPSEPAPDDDLIDPFAPH